MEATNDQKTSEQTLDPKTNLLRDLHKRYIVGLDAKKDTFEYWVTEHLRVSGMYWGLAAMDVLQSLEEMDRKYIIDYVASCQTSDGGFGGNVEHDAHLLYTLSAIQVLVMLDGLDSINVEAVVNFVSKLQREDGSFSGDKWGEIDTRFSYIASCTLALLKRLDTINGEKAIEFIVKCKNFDGGFGAVPGAESHAGQVFCCVGALAILGGLQHIDADVLGWWLAERQIKEGGLNGRPEKLPDVCYSWWVLSSLAIIDRLHWIDHKKLHSFILDCQDDDAGGIADRPGDIADVYHTFFGVAGLSLTGFGNLNPVDPAFAINPKYLERLGIDWRSKSSPSQSTLL
eukprot:TRINITY_DN10958_c0_g1_i1.p1 TRINITY_DN10958_c0_g1~~TRINITY_DN10958_c0_g1_i1.p1  ORF type:complete len:342 (-),score=87.07 TRINITY_DN10958_c0_g1_i1:29-1054(-)